MVTAHLGMLDFSFNVRFVALFRRRRTRRPKLSDIFHEVEEDLRREKMDALWKKYGPIVLMAAGSFVLIVAILLWWTDHKVKVSQERSDRFIAAVELLDGGNLDAGLAGLDALIEENAGGYRLLAEMEKAGMLTKAGDTVAAVAIYDQVTSGGRGGKIFSELAAIKAGWLIVETEDFANVQARLGGIASGATPFASAAKEIIAYGAFRSGDFVMARDLYQEIMRVPSATPGVRGRSGEMLSIILPQVPVVPEDHSEHGHEATEDEAAASSEEAAPAEEDTSAVDGEGDQEAQTPPAE
jgi:hypothetical protein